MYVNTLDTASWFPRLHTDAAAARRFPLQIQKIPNPRALRASYHLLLSFPSTFFSRAMTDFLDRERAEYTESVYRRSEQILIPL